MERDGLVLFLISHGVLSGHLTPQSRYDLCLHRVALKGEKIQ